MLMTLAGRQLTTENYRIAIQIINDRMGRKFSKGVSEIVTCKSRVVDSWEVEETGARFVCEDPRLSMPCMGKEFQAIDLKRCNRDVPKIDADELHFVLDLAAAALDVEKHEAKTPSEK